MLDKRMNLSDLEFVEITPSSPTRLGWRHDHLISDGIRRTIAHYVAPDDETSRCFSPSREVSIAPFKIATQTFAWELLSKWDDDTIESIGTLSDFCVRLEVDLERYGWRLPTEDEFEAACGGAMFPWGNDIPQGTPYGDLTDFTQHKEINENGLYLNDTTYNVEVTRSALKLGDGGVSVCGAYEWPIPWLSFCPAFFVPSCLLDECVSEYLENAQVRPVLLDYDS